MAAWLESLKCIGRERTVKSSEKKRKDWISGQQGNKTVNKEAMKRWSRNFKHWLGFRKVFVLVLHAWSVCGYVCECMCVSMWECVSMWVGGGVVILLQRISQKVTVIQSLQYLQHSSPRFLFYVSLATLWHCSEHLFLAHCPTAYCAWRPYCVSFAIMLCTVTSSERWASWRSWLPVCIDMQLTSRKYTHHPLIQVSMFMKAKIIA